MNPIRLKRPGAPEPLSETAAAWLLRVEEGSLGPRDEARFRQWLAVPEHAAAYEDALWGLDALQRHSAAPELMAMREAALARRPEPSRQTGLAAGIAALAAAFAGVMLWVNVAQGPADIAVPPGREVAGAPAAMAGLYRTGVGERSAVVLPDGSVATLDTDSQLRVAYSKAERAVHLIEGQALFEVAKGKALPFSVYARGQLITAVGTTFNVRIRGEQVQVAMVEGVVKVRPAEAAERPGAPVQELTLRAGEELVTQPARPVVVTAVDTSEVATWRGGLLVFEDDRLKDAVAEINRYTTRPIRLADASIGEYRVTGVFKTNDPAHFATAMSEVFPLEVGQDATGAPVLKAQK